MTYIILMASLYIPALFGMNFSTTDLLCVPHLFRPDHGNAQDNCCHLFNLPTDVFNTSIFPKLTLRDYSALMRTCTQFNTNKDLSFNSPSIGKQILTLHDRTADHTIKIFVPCVATFLGTCLALGEALSYLPVDRPTRAYYGGVIAVGSIIPLVACMSTILIHAYNKSRTEHFNTITDYHLHAAKLINEGRLTTHALTIDYYNAAQASHFMAIAQTHPIKNVTLHIHAYQQHPIQLTPLLTHNTQLQSLTIIDNYDTLDLRDLYIGIVNNNSLTQLRFYDELQPVTIKTFLKLINTTHPQITKVAFTASDLSDATEVLQELAKNTTLTHLSLNRCSLSDFSIAHLITFMQQNRNLQSLKLKGNDFTQPGKTQLSTSPCKPNVLEL